jgi:hypothetical protein
MLKWNKHGQPLRGLLACALLLPLAALAGEQSLENDFAPEGATRLVLRAKVADIRVRGTDAAQIQSHLKAEDDGAEFLFWSSEGLAPEELARIRVEAQRSGDTLELRIRVPEEYEEEDIGFDWTLSVPRGLALEIRNDVGDIEVDGIGGGVTATADVGDVELEVPGGDLTVRVDVGDVTLRTASMPGLLDLESDVGDVEARVGDRELPVKHPEYGPGASLQTRLGEGAAIRARADVGDIELETR